MYAPFWVSGEPPEDDENPPPDPFWMMWFVIVLVMITIAVALSFGPSEEAIEEAPVVIQE